MSRVFTLPSDLCFVTTLAEGLWRRTEGDPLKLAEMTVFLPTRRACRHLRDAFLRVGKAKAALLPRLRPLGDLDEEELFFSEFFDLSDVPPALTSLRRRMLLTSLIAKKDDSLPLDLAASLASALASLLDQVQTEEKSLNELESLVPEDYAEHWQQTLAFLGIITQAWPVIKKEEGALDPAERRNLVMAALGGAWEKEPPVHPVIVAGSTGSVPSVSRLMSVIARLPRGEVVLPGLDLLLDDEAWREVDETHPQYTMKKWMESASVRREDVTWWEGFEPRNLPRLRLLRESMRPAGLTESWRELGAADLPPEAVKGFEKIELDHHREEADVIALRLRAVLEEEGRTAALVTPDRGLALRVASALGRWGIEANDSAGEGLDKTQLGSFLLALLSVASEKASPVDYLALLKHPLTHVGTTRADVLSCARRAEILVWRGVRPSGGLATAARLAARQDAEIAAWLSFLEGLFAPFSAEEGGKKEIVAWIDLHLSLAETMAQGDGQSGAERLWRDAAGDKAVAWLDEWRRASAGFPPVSFGDYARLFAALMREEKVRPAFGFHPRLSLLGPLEARLLHHDVTILGGLNDDTWPPAASVDPWLSRPMKKQMGLPTPERRIGLSAHDFVSLAAAPRVMVTRARRVGGVPTVPSRFLMQIQAVLKAAGQPDADVSLPWRDWARGLDAPSRSISLAPPEPRPLLKDRPQKLSVTEIGVWLRNPYGIYAKHVLNLKKLDDIDADISAADKGSAIHKALENFMRESANNWPKNPLELLLEKGREAFEPFRDRPQIEAFWWPRFEKVAEFFVERERLRRRDGLKPLYVEARGETKSAEGFVLTGRVDRVDLLPDGRIEIIDYKTGSIPTGKQVRTGFEPQLPLLAMMAQEGGFDKSDPRQSARLSYWGIHGSKAEETEVVFEAEEIETLMEEARRGLENLVCAFARKETPYRVVPRPQHAPRYDDYAHLSRIAEWSRGEGDEE